MKRRKKRRDVQRKNIERRPRPRKKLRDWVPNKSRESVRNVRGCYLRANRTKRASMTRSLESHHHLHHQNQNIRPIELECIIVTLYL
jgi:hypothetical protein